MRPSSIHYFVDGGEFNRTMNEKLLMPRTINFHSHSPGLQLERFCEHPEDERNNDELCKIKSVHCQGTENYNGHNIIVSYKAFVSDREILSGGGGCLQSP